MNYDDFLLGKEEKELFSRQAQKENVPLANVLYAENRITETQYLSLLSQEFGISHVPDMKNLINQEHSPWSANFEEICLFSIQWLRKNIVIPLYYNNIPVLGICNIQSWSIKQELEFLLQKQFIFPVLLEKESVQYLINLAFNSVSQENSEELLQQSENKSVDFDDDTIDDVLDDSNETPFIRFVNHVLAQAIRLGASDIHIEPYREESRIRFRLDGVLYDKNKLEKSHHAAVVSRIKVMAKLNIAEKRLPQDGRITIALGDREVGLRVSTLPTSFGERVVLRLLEKSERILSLNELGLTPSCFAVMKEFISMPNGIILVTGPTGSGKTTTLYAALQEIASPSRNILTIEDPVEYELDGIGQVQVNTKIGLTFANGLRTLVRQDPDVILIGEIRDQETASIAVQSALTGHLVFSTLHTNDAPSAITRLLDMDVESFLLSSVLRGVIAQRLVRVLCPHCKTAYSPNKDEMMKLGRAAEHMQNNTLYKPQGCPECMNTGYKGRIAIYEMMPIHEKMKKLIVDKTDSATIRQFAEENGMYSLYLDGMIKVAQGITSLTELTRVINA